MAQQPLPTPVNLNLNNIQGDILSGLPKKTQTYFFFQITDATLFRQQLPHLVPLITTVAGVLKDRKAIEDHKRRNGHGFIHMVGVNVAFSHKGFQTLNIDDSVLAATSPVFGTGQKKDAQHLGDKGTGTDDTFVPDWDSPFLQDIHGVILVSGDSHASVKQVLLKVEHIFGIGTSKPSVKEVTSLVGDVRPGKESGHEHFGFLDGISNPAVIGFDVNPDPGPHPVPASSILTGQDDGTGVTSAPPLVADGSFLAIRYLVQKVPEFNEFLKAHPVQVPGLSPEEGSELLGARMVGRWKSGAPIDLAPFEDDPDLIQDPERRNNFRFQAEASVQKICPFASHIRKTNPRADLEDNSNSGPAVNPTALQNRKIMRRGVQFGPEVTPHEKRTGKSEHDRGLIFACYQSNIDTAFAFIQKSWANNTNFPPFTKPAPGVPGLDPLIGQSGPDNENAPRKMSGLDPNNPANELPFPDFIIPRGGEYFFSPSIKGLKEAIAAA